MRLLQLFLLCGEQIAALFMGWSATENNFDREGRQKLQTDSQRLMDRLLSSCDSRVRSVRSSTTRTNVTLRLPLNQILDVNERNQNIVLSMSPSQFWVDEFLGWDPEEFGGTNKAIIPWEQIWLPDTYLYNSLVMEREANERWINVEVTTDGSKGHMRFMYPAIFTFSCKLNVRYFPFDQQNCTMIFGSWTGDSHSIDYYPESEQIEMSNYVEHEEWTVTSFNMYRQELTFSCCPIPYAQIHAHLVIQRKPLYYIINLILPTAIITLVAIIGFFTSSSSTGERTEKVNMGITTLLAMAILLLIVSNSMPATSNFVPLIGWFLLGIIILVSVGTLLSSAVICIHRKDLNGDPLPSVVRKVLDGCLPSFFGVPLPKKLASYWKSQAPKAGKRITKSTENPYGELLSELSSLVQQSTGSRRTIEQRVELPTQKPQVSDQEIAGLIELEWAHAANVLDRFLLVAFVSILFIVCFMVILIGMLHL